MTRIAMMLAASWLCMPLGAQWLNYPTPGIPHTPDGKPDLSAPPPRTADGKPDLSGIWVAATGVVNDPILGPIQRPLQRNNIEEGLAGGLPLRPWARDLMKARQADEAIDSPITHCLPAGPILTHTISAHGQVLKKMIHIPGLLVILSEYNTMYRQIFTDGRPLPTDPQPSWNGYSTGKWNGDTLVVDTSGFRDGLWLDLRAGTPLTDAAKLTEKFRRPNFGNLEIEITVDDPKASTKPWTVKLAQTVETDTDLLDYVCLENEKDLQHIRQK